MIDNYDKLTIAKYYEVMDILKDDDTDISKQTRLLCCLGDRTMDDVLDMPYSEFEEESKMLDFIFTVPKSSTRIPDRIKVGDMTYKVMKDVTKMTAGQYIDFQTYANNGMGIEYLLSCVLIPEGEKYGESDAMETITHIKENLSITVAVGIKDFFVMRLLTSTRITLIYLDWMMRRVSRQAKRNPAVKEKVNQIREMMKEMRSLLNGVG